MVSCEVLKTVTSILGKGWLTYRDLLGRKEEGAIYLKSEEEISYKYNWLGLFQIREQFKKDNKENGIRLELSDFEEIILEDKKKLIGRIYKKLLEWSLADEQIKEYMIK